MHFFQNLFLVETLMPPQDLNKGLEKKQNQHPLRRNEFSREMSLEEAGEKIRVLSRDWVRE